MADFSDLEPDAQRILGDIQAAREEGPEQGMRLMSAYARRIDDKKGPLSLAEQQVRAWLDRTLVTFILRLGRPDPTLDRGLVKAYYDGIEDAKERERREQGELNR